MAKIFDLDSFRNGKKGQPSPDNDPDSSDSTRMAGNHVQPIDMPQEVSGGSWLRSSSLISANAGAGLLVVFGILCGLCLGGSDKKSAVAISKPNDQIQTHATPQPTPPARPLSKPSPIIPAGTARVGGPVVAKQAPSVVPKLRVVPKLPTFSVPRYPPMRYEATHKKVFGGCTGQLELTGASLHFSCPNQADLNFPIDAIANAHKDGVVLKSGKKYHFIIANHSKDQVEAIFISWLNRVQQFQQPSRVSSF